MKTFYSTFTPLNAFNSFLLKLPTPANINFFWNFGSLLGISLIVQIITGIFLAIQYRSEINTAFFRVNMILRDINNGWLLRVTHSNGASIFFFCLYLHIARGLYFKSYFNKTTWVTGSIIFLIVIATAFLGYVLPWGQISL